MHRPVKEEDKLAVKVVRIEASHDWFGSTLKELWVYRELLYYLIWRDVKVKYKQTAIGAAWAVFQPLITMVIFAVVFRMFVEVPSDGVPYTLLSFTALLPWNLF